MAGNYHISGKCVTYAPARAHRFGDENETDKRDHKTKSYSMNRKNRQKVFDGATYQNHIASKDAKLSHCFFTLTYHANDYDNANIHIGTFMDKLRKHCQRVYPQIGDNFSFIWVRELTKKEVDHFHVMAVLPVFYLDSKVRKHKDIKHSIPFYYPGEQDQRYFSLNKCWCDCRGYYSSNAVRISERNGKKMFIIDDIQSAIRYCAKYVSKGQTVENAEGQKEFVKSSKPVLGMSRNLKPWTKPLKYDDILGFCFDPFYGDSFKFTDKETGEVTEKKILESDFAKVGKVQLSKAAKLYFDLQKYQAEQEIRLLENAVRLKRIEKKAREITELRQKQGQIFSQ